MTRLHPELHTPTLPAVAGAAGEKESANTRAKKANTRAKLSFSPEKVRAPVSWDAGHVFWVWRCERGPPRGGAGVEPS